VDIDPPGTRLIMQRALRASILTLLFAPFVLLLMAAGIIFLWENPWLLKWIWLPIPGCWLLGYGLYRFARRHHHFVWQPRAEPLMTWTDQDHAAWQLVIEFADQTESAAVDHLFAGQFYLDTTRELAEQLATHYHPHAHDALDQLTIPEVLSATELAISDVRQFVEQQVPGSHLMTIGWLRRAPRATRFWRQLRPFYDTAYYTAALIWHPWTLLSRAAAKEAVIHPVMAELKREGLAGIYRAFILQLGKYLIELNSHRLNVGPERWRALMLATGHDQERVPSAGHRAPRSSSSTSTPAPELQIALVGQVKAGKSSLVNALLGHQEAAVDILPLTDTLQRYTIHPDRLSARLVLLDCVGYAQDGLPARRVEETMQAICQSAMTILVVNICDPARQPDLALLSTMRSWFRQHPQRRRPPILVAATHIDQLSPVLQWNPPYDGWVHPHATHAKERSIHAAVLHLRELFGDQVEGVVPACTDVDHDRAYGVEEWVVPALLNLLPQAHAKHLLDVLFEQRHRGRFHLLVSQLCTAGRLLAKYQFCGPSSLMPEPPANPDPPTP